MPKVSVVIPAYNAMAYLPETVESVLRQTFTDFELLIIDDGSLDQTAQWASQLTDPRVKLISQQNQGLSGARNTGIAHAEGEYIAFLDADDLWKPTKLEKQVRCLEENPEIGLVDTWTVLVNEQGRSTGRVFASHAEGDISKQIVVRNTVPCGSSAMVRRCCFETLGVFSRDLSSLEDWDMWIRIASRYCFSVVKELLVCYRQHPSNMSKNCQVMLQNFRTVIEKAFQTVPVELLYLRGQSYGYANLALAWKSLQNKDRDYKQAIYFRRQALAHYPQLCYFWEFIRLSFAILVMQSLGPHGYNRILPLFYALRRRISSVVN